MAVPGKKLSAGTGNEWVGVVLSEQRTAISDQEANPAALFAESSMLNWQPS